MPERVFTIPAQEPVKWIVPGDFEGIIAYNPRHDIQDYLDLKNLDGKIPQAQYAGRLIQTNNRTHHNLEKALGERLAVEKSIFHYFLDETGELWSEDYPEPVITRYEIGQRFLEEKGSNEVKREKAEINGIKEVRRILAQCRDVTLVIASPRSKNCKHGKEENPKDEDENILYHDNYFDVYVQSGKNVTVTRYHSTHTYQGFLDALCQIDPNYQKTREGQVLNPAYMLARPAQTQQPITRILEKFALNHKTKSSDVCQEATEACTPLFLSYIRTLIENPLAIERIKLTWNAILNTFDDTVKSIEQTKREKAFAKFKKDKANAQNVITPTRPFFQNVEKQIQIKGREPVRTVSGGPCPGKQKGFGLSSVLSRFARAIGAKSVADFASFASGEDEDHGDFPCPRCNYIITYGAGIKQCPGCGLEATCA